MSVKEGVKAVSRVHRSLKIFFATLACFTVAGVLLLSDDPEITEEVPYHQEIAIGFLVFGTLLLLVTIAGDSPFGVRLKGLLGGLTAFVVVAVGLYLLVPAVEQATALSKRGRTTTGTVLRTRWTHRGKKLRSEALVRYDEHRAWVDSRKAQGSRIEVVYDPDHPETVMAGEKGTFLEMLDRDFGTWWALGISVLVLYLFFAGLVGFKRMLLGAPRPEPRPEQI